jgi:CubicO group peptidase (beta-lactamase class C family)
MLMPAAGSRLLKATAALLVSAALSAPVVFPALDAETPERGMVRDVSEGLQQLIGKHPDVVPSLAVAAVEDGFLKLHGVAGIRRIGSPEAVTISDKFHLGSCTKSMTSVLGALLVKNGQLSWDTTVSDVFGESVDIHPDYRGATLRQLLSNTAGCPRDVPGMLWGALWLMPISDPQAQRSVLLRGILGKPPVYKPGQGYEYSNASFAIAGAMMESTTGIPYETMMKEWIFWPLGMASAGFGPPDSTGSLAHPHGHKSDSGSLKPVNPFPGGDNPPAIAPAGRVHCTIDDFARYVRFLLQGHPSIPLSLEDIEFLFEPCNEDQSYAMGFGVTSRSWAGGIVLNHHGSNTMFYCVMWVAPEIDFAIVAACNSGHPEARDILDKAIIPHIPRRGN